MKYWRRTAAFAAVLVSGCGTTDITKNVDDTLKVSAQYGSIIGSWDRASQDANEKALIYCQGMGKRLILIEERRDGIWGISPQRAEVKFRCSSEADSTGTPKKPSSLEARLSEIKSLHEKGLLTREQYDAQVNRILSGN